MAASPAQVLPEGVGWAVVVALAIGFSFVMLAIIWIQKRQLAAAGIEGDNDNDEFSSASRSVPPGLLASGIVSAWTWSATLEQSAAVGYKYGVSGPFWVSSCYGKRAATCASSKSSVPLEARSTRDFAFNNKADISVISFGHILLIVCRRRHSPGSAIRDHSIQHEAQCAIC